MDDGVRGSTMSISTKALRIISIVLAGVMGVAVAGTIWADRAGSGRAFAEEVKADMARSYRGASTWRAHIEEREQLSEGVYRTTRYRVTVGGPDRYRIESIERDEDGQDVVSVTLRRGSTVYSATPTEGGGIRVLELRNTPPSLGAASDNMLGQRVRDLARAGQMRYLGRDSVRGKAALKLLVEPDHIAWVDTQSSIPLREHFLSDGTVTHEIEFLLFEPDSAIDPAEFDPASLGASPSVTEDLGFRPTDLPSAPTALLGFVPRRFMAPGDWLLVESGYIDPDTPSEGAPDSPAWISHYETALGPVLVTQSGAPEGFLLAPETGDGPDGPLLTEVAGNRVAYYTDPWRTHATMHVGDVLVAVEGMLPADAVLASLSWIR
jgi:outer membrane lipoprotein-sorting protein